MDMVDGAFNIARVGGSTVWAIVAAYVIPMVALSLWAGFETIQAATDTIEDALSATSVGGPVFFEQPPGGSVWLSILSTIAPMAGLPFLGAALTHLLGGWRQGKNLTAWECCRKTLMRAHVLFISFVFGRLFLIVTCGIGMPFVALISSVVAAEDAGPWTAFRRSMSLTGLRPGPAYGLQLLVWLVLLLVSTAFGVLPYIGLVFLGDWGWIALAIGQMLLTGLSTLLGVGAAVLFYFDVRTRNEGLDLSERIEELIIDAQPA